MKRFYTDVAVIERHDGWVITLDDRPVRTPGRAMLAIDSVPLAHAIASEWRAQEDVIEPASMKLTGIANAAIDLVAADPAAFAAPLALFGESDLLCYRALDTELAREEAAAWDPVLAWAEDRFGIAFAVTSGIVHVAQPPATTAALSRALHLRPPWRLAALSPVISIGGSLVAALALDEGAFTAAALWDAATLNERWQEQRWGADDDAVAARANKRRDWDAAARFLELL